MVEKDEKLAGVVELCDDQLVEVAGGGRGGKPGHCPGCGSTSFTDLGGGEILCNDCGWKGSKASIGL